MIQYSLPYKSVQSALPRYTTIFVFVVNYSMAFSQIRFPRRAIAVVTLPLRLFRSASKDRLLAVVEP